MKRVWWLSMCVMLLGSSFAMGQAKIGYVSTEAIMKQLPDAQDAQKQLDQLVVDWQAELNKMQQDWQKKFDDYEKRKLIMTEQR